MRTPKIESIGDWDKVFEYIERIAANPLDNIALIKALTVNLRVETGSLPGYRGGGFAEKIDSVALSRQMREKLEDLMGIDLSSDDMYLLVRQLVKSLPFFGASQDEVRTVRGLAEEIEYSFSCPITEDIRAEVHSKLSPRNLDLVRGLLSYVERADPEPLRKINKYQKVFQYSPDKFRNIAGLLHKLQSELSNIFEPHPGKIEDRLKNIHRLLNDVSHIVSPEVNGRLSYLLGSIEKGDRSFIRTNMETLLSLLDDAIDRAENPNFRNLFANIKNKLENIDYDKPEEILVLIEQWRRDAVSVFFPSLLEPLEEFVGYIRNGDTLGAALILGDLRMSLRRTIKDPFLQSQTMAVMLEAIWFDLTLERIGYIVFGEVNNVVLADITVEKLPVAIDVINSMILNVRAKGQGSPKLEEYSSELLNLKRSRDLNFYTVCWIVERMNAEIAAATDKIVKTYFDTTRQIFTLRQIPNTDEAASAFVDGLFRETTLQHLSELTLKLLNFSRIRIASVMKHVRHPPIREISPGKVSRIRHDIDALTGKIDPSRLAYFFRSGAADGFAACYPLLGEKGAYLAEMARLGASVPPGFTLTTKVCNLFFSDGHALSNETRDLIFNCLEELEEMTGRVLGSPDKPLLLAVRAGSCISMPGMMDTILNIGLNDETVEGLGQITGNPLFAYECYYRLISKYSSSVMGFTDDGAASTDEAESAWSSAVEMRQMVKRLLEAVAEATGARFPQDPREQIMGALGAIFSSWQSESAITYRQIFNIPYYFGTAATIQQMVFGNREPKSCSGVVFSRNPITGVRHIFGEYLPRSQGEVLVSGRSTPLPLSAGQHGSNASLSLESRLPRIYRELEEEVRKLELHFRDMQDIEFTVEENVLYLLQTRPAKRTDYAALKVAVDLVHEGVIDEHTAVERLKEAGLKQLFLPVFSPNAPKQLIAKGNAASPGVAAGRLAFTREDAVTRAQAGEDIVLVANRTIPKDIGAIAASRGVLTREGGMTSHAAINSRRMAKPCVTGCQTLDIDKKAQILRLDSTELGPGDVISIDGYSGEVFLGAVKIIDPQHLQAGSDKTISEIAQYLDTYLEWEKEFPGDAQPAALRVADQP